MILKNFVNMKTPMISALLILTCLAFFAVAAQARPLSESRDNKISMIVEYGKRRAFSPPPPPKPASPTQQITSGFNCDLENNQCTHSIYTEKRKYSPPPPPKSSPSPHEVTRPDPPPPKLSSSPPCSVRRPCLTISTDYGRTPRPPPPAPKPAPPRHHDVDVTSIDHKLMNETSSKDIYLASS